MEKYILVQWPESQMLMEHKRFNECLLVQDINNHNEVGSSAYMCPEDLYEKIFKTDNIESLRIGNVCFRKATYLGNEPEFPSWHIDFFYPNPYYGKENEYKKDGDYYIKVNVEYPINIHKDCFKHKETCYAIASFIRDKEGYYELSFIGDRPLNLNKTDFDDFMKLVKYGNKKLNELKEDD